MRFPLERYKYQTDNKTIVVAISTYAGKTVRGIAKCDPEDAFDLEKGKELAALRCAKKIEKMRLNYLKESVSSLEMGKFFLEEEIRIVENMLRESKKDAKSIDRDLNKVLKELR